MTDLREALEKVQAEIGERSPLIADLIRLVREGELSVEQGVRDVWLAAAEDEELAAATEAALLRALNVEVTSGVLARLPDRENLLQRWGFTEEDLIYQPHPDRPTKMLNPIFMGAIIELLQFDGDIPELRTGKLPEGGSPAVPVRTTAHDPVVVGAMLRTAREQVTRELAEAQSKHDGTVTALAETLGTVGAAGQALVARATSHVVSVPGYRPGHAAEFREVEEPTALSVARLPLEERQRLAHLALTSTQGRRSLVSPITDLVLSALRAEGYEGIKDGIGGAIVAEAEWVVQVDGAAEHNPKFNFVASAARSLTLKLKAQLGKPVVGKPLLLTVTPTASVADRFFGWRVALHEVCSA